MSYDAAVLRRATARLEEEKRRRQRALEQRRAEVELRVPRVAEIDEKLRLTLLEVARATFRGGDPTAAIEALRDENLALQAEREQLLAAAGYPADVLEDKPACPKCEDRGWVDMGFPDDAIRLAYERTVMKKQSLNWPYMNSILKNWHAKGLHTIAEIQAGDSDPGRKKTAPAQPKSTDAGERLRRDMEWLERFAKENERGD